MGPDMKIDSRPSALDDQTKTAFRPVTKR